jgi:hypothetical protein
MNFVNGGSYKSKKQEAYQKLDFSCQNKLKYETPSMVIVFSAIALVIK